MNDVKSSSVYPVQVYVCIQTNSGYTNFGNAIFCGKANEEGCITSEEAVRKR